MKPKTSDDGLVSNIATNIDWSLLYQNRKQVAKQFGTLWQLPIKKRHHQVVREYSLANSSWLEIGAGSRNLKPIIEECNQSCQYKSYDIDQRNFHDFYSLEEIKGQYDRIVMLEVIEHITLDHAAEVLQRCFSVLKPNGKILISTPNIYYPPAFLRDVTHITPWAYDELGGFLQLNGFSVENIYRIYHDALIRKIPTLTFMRPVHKLMGIDYSKQIIIVAARDSHTAK